jgi:putative transposase
MCEVGAMARPPRTDYPGATHHIYNHAVAGSVVASDAVDFEHTLSLLEHVASQFELQCHAWCFLPNHFHLLATSKLGNLSKAMHWLGMCTAQAYNRRYERPGHLFRGRFRSKLVEDDEYLLELCRYLPRNPVRAGLCSTPEEWPWSSYSSTVTDGKSPWFLDPAAFVDLLGSRDSYASWVANGASATYLDARGIPLPPPRPTLADLLAIVSEAALATAHFRHGYSKSAIAAHLGISRQALARRLKPSI